MPHTGRETERLAELAVSCLLIGWGMCSIGRGVRTESLR
jgi:hypothetical protein